MALIFRSIVEVDGDEQLIARSSDLFRAWLRQKVRNPTLDLVADGNPREIAVDREALAAIGESGGRHGFRASLLEKRDQEEVKTTLTALVDGESVWAWVDLERWAEDAWRGSWVPYSPRIVSSLLREVNCKRGTDVLAGEVIALEGADASRLSERVLDPQREVPLVVATPTQAELEGDLAPAEERATELQRRLAGVAPVYLLRRGAVSAFSQQMTDGAGADMDVHSGAVRTYLPGAGTDRDAPWRHRFVPYRRLERRPSDLAARLVSAPLMRAASHQPPPTGWRELRSLPEFGGGASDADLEELLASADEEIAEGNARLKEADARSNELEADLDDERAAQAELLAEREDLVRRIRYMEGLLREQGAHVEPPAGEPLFVPDFCEEVVAHAEGSFSLLKLGSPVVDGARQLDDHAEASWARKALRSLEALQAYAAEKASGWKGNFRQFCTGSDSLSTIPTSWISMQESETTDQNPKFRSMRTFEVDAEVSADGAVYMPAHIKLTQGGYPSPRIHFYDDTDGASGKIHVGWLGPHLDNKSKN